MSESPRTIAALFVDSRGPYLGMPGVEIWDYRRNAMLYDRDHPVVSHPPCGPWSAFKHLYRGNEHACALRAVEQIRRVGGVLEHPAESLLWRREDLGLPAVDAASDAHGGFTILVDQVHWGHRCSKKTWLYLIGVDPALARAGIRSGGVATHYMTGARGRNKGNLGNGLIEASHEIRRRTPPLFADWLVSLARQVKR